MQKLILYVFSNHKDFVLEIHNDSGEAVSRYLELISIFWNITDKGIELIPIIQMNDEIRNKYNTFVKKYKKEVPRLNRLKSSLDQIKNNEFFFTSNKSGHTPKEILFIGNLIDVHNTTDNDKERAELFQKKLDIQDDFFGDLLAKYDIKVFDSSQKYSIGESNRQKRICRFCSNGMDTKNKVTFKLKAHAISEALGNKLIVLNEECDICNAKFGITIEKDFIQYLDIYRVFFKVKGKNGIPKIKFNNNGLITNIKKENMPQDDLLNNNENLMVITSRDIMHNSETGELTALLKSNEKIKEVNIYKTLCKYAISTIDTGELQYLKNTIKWISEEGVWHNLPKVATIIINEMYVENPCISLYIRNNDDYNYPHVVAEFKFKSLIFVYILPFSSKDKIDFISEESYNLFWKTFKHYDTINTWTYNNFSSVESKEYQFNMQMVNKNTNKTE